MNLALLRADLTRDEGKRSKVYFDSLGIPTAGVGRNMRDVGLSDEEINFLLDNDIAKVLKQLDEKLGWWRTLDEVRQRVLANMCFQLGINGLLNFKNTLKAVQESRWDDAAAGMKNSLWGKQTPVRVDRLAEMMRHG